MPIVLKDIKKIYPGSKEPVIEGLVANAFDCTLDGTTISTFLQNPNDGTYGFGLGIAKLNDDTTLSVIDEKYEYFKN